MAPQAKDKQRRAPAVRVIFRYGLIIIGASLLLTTCIYASQRFQRFIIRDPRFILPGPADYGLESPNLEIQGVKYASRAQILRVFEPDMGRSVFLFPLKSRRKELLNVRWGRECRRRRRRKLRGGLRLVRDLPDLLGALEQLVQHGIKIDERLQSANARWQAIPDK